MTPHIPLVKRLTILVFNLLFPPLAVGTLTGFTSRETLLNSLLFLLAVLPSHVHGLYISTVYFTRKRRVRKGRWPGHPGLPGIWSEKVLTGGAGWEEARDLKEGRRRVGVLEGFGGRGRERGGDRSRSRNRSRSCIGGGRGVDDGWRRETRTRTRTRARSRPASIRRRSESRCAAWVANANLYTDGQNLGTCGNQVGGTGGHY